MNETKRIIVEFGARRQQFLLTENFISTRKLLCLIGNRFDIQLENNNSSYILQMYNNLSKEYDIINDYKHIFDVIKDFEQFHRFRIINKSLQIQKHHLLNNLQSTVKKLSNATQHIDKIQNLVGTLDHNCDKLNQLMDTCHSNSSSSYIFDPSTMQKEIDVPRLPIDNDYDDDDENFESVSCFDNTPIYSKPTIITLKQQQQVLKTDNNIQTRIIPCKYAVRGTCHLGDKCSYLHDETCIQSAREWERRL